MDLAALANVDHKTIYQIENGNNNITLKTLVNICCALEIDLKELIG